MCSWAIARPDDFQKGVRIRGPTFEFYCERREKKNLDGGTRRILADVRRGTFRVYSNDGQGMQHYPERTRDAISVGNPRGLEQSGGPSPRRHDSRGYKTRLNSAPSSAEHLTGLLFTLVALQNPCGKDHSQRECEAKTDHNSIAVGLAQRSAVGIRWCSVHGCGEWMRKFSVDMLPL